MKTYQDLIEIGENEEARMDFVLQAINQHKSSGLYLTAIDAELYYRHLNPTIMRAQKFVYNLMGKAVPDVWSANNKIPSRYYFYFVTQAVQFLLGNGVSFNNDTTKGKLGKRFDNVIQKLATDALNGGVSFAFWNNDHLEQFSVTEFVPLYDEENGTLRAGIRFWQVADDKPLRATLYEENGLTEYIKRKDKDMAVLKEKRDYKQIVSRSEASANVEISNGGNYPGFPIIPFYNINGQSELVGNRETIDAYDLMASALINNIDDANLIYWVIKNAGGMSDEDDLKFVQRLKTLHAVHTDDNTDVDMHTVDVPFEASETALNRLRIQLFDDFMALDTRNIASGSATATQIKAAYEPLNEKTDLFEYQVTDFILSLLELVGIEDIPSYTRSMIVNKQEEIQSMVLAANYLSEDYITKKVLEINGDIDEYESVKAERISSDMERFNIEDEGEE